MTPFHCCRCGRESNSAKGRPYQLCGPCWLDKPVGWWDGYEEWVKKVVGLSK